MKVLAFDQATTTGWCLGEDKFRPKDWISGRFQAPKRPELGERLLIVFSTVSSLATKYQPDLIAYELVYDPIRELIEQVKKGNAADPRRYNPATIAFLHQVVGHVQSAAAQCSIPTEGYAPRTWRSTLSLPRPPEGLAIDKRTKFVKQATLTKVRAMGANVRTEDEADAFGLCYHVLCGKPSIGRGQGDLLDMAEETLR